MSRETLETLFRPLHTGALPLPARGQRVLFLGAPGGLVLPEGFEAELTAVQGFRPDFLALQRGGFRVAAEPEGEGYDMALVLAGRHRGQNEAFLAEAVQRIRQDGVIVVAGSNTDGAAALRKRLMGGDDRLTRGQNAAVIEGREGGASDVIGGDRLYHPSKTAVPIDGHLSKNHGVVFWLRRTPEADAYAATMKAWQGNWPLIDRRFETAPGMFSFDRIDEGSRLLVESLPSILKGAVADFCAGWGYLSAELAARAPAPASIDLYEADHASLEAARGNMGRLAPNLPVAFFWQDLVSEPVARRYDAIVMNPPFHAGRAAEPGLGQKLIGVASRALKPGGQLFLVANRQLPYETTLAAGFGRVEKLREDKGFKIFRAAR